jgi:hypothetical protein
LQTLLRRPRDRQEGNIKIDLIESRWECVNLINLTQDRDQRRAVLNVVMNLQVPYNAGNFLTT